MVQADADIMLIDEVLAVGDAAVRAEVHGRLPRAPRGGQDDRARHPRHGHGPVDVPPRDADPRRARRSTSATPRRRRSRYYRLNFAGPTDGRSRDEREPTVDFNARSSTATLRDRAGARSRTSSRAADRARRGARGGPRASSSPAFGFHLRNDDGVVVFGFNSSLDEPEVAPGCARMRLAGRDREPARARAATTSTAGSGRPRARATSRSRGCGCSSSSSTGRRRATESSRARPTSTRRGGGRGR